MEVDAETARHIGDKSTSNTPHLCLSTRQRTTLAGGECSSTALGLRLQHTNSAEDNNSSSSSQDCCAMLLSAAVAACGGTRKTAKQSALCVVGGIRRVGLQTPNSCNLPFPPQVDELQSVFDLDDPLRVCFCFFPSFPGGRVGIYHMVASPRAAFCGLPVGDFGDLQARYFLPPSVCTHVLLCCSALKWWLLEPACGVMGVSPLGAMPLKAMRFMSLAIAVLLSLQRLFPVQCIVLAPTKHHRHCFVLQRCQRYRFFPTHALRIRACAMGPVALERSEEMKRSTTRLPEDHLLRPAFQQLEHVLTRYRRHIYHSR